MDHSASGLSLLPDDLSMGARKKNAMLLLRLGIGIMIPFTRRRGDSGAQGEVKRFSRRSSGSRERATLAQEGYHHHDTFAIDFTICKVVEERERAG